MLKLLKILIFLIILVAIGLGVYWFFDRQQGGTGNPLGNGISIGNFFPFGTGGTPPPPPTGTGTGTTTNQLSPIPTEPPRFWQISTEPQSGAVSFISSSTPFVRFVDKATGNVFESSLKLLGLKRISNTTIPKIYEAKWQPGGKSVVLRFLDTDDETIRTAYATLIPGKIITTENNGVPLQTLDTVFLSDNITSLSVHPTTGALAYLVENLGGARVFTTGATGGSPKQILETPIKDFKVSWVDSGTISLATKPSSGVAGQFYFLKTATGALSRGMSGQNGLIALSSGDSSKIAYSEVKSGVLTSGIYIPKTGETIFTPLILIPEKCVWSLKNIYLYCSAPKSVPSGKQPDSWYQGRVSFSDVIWRIDSSTGITDLLIDPGLSNVNIDGINLILDPNEEYLMLTNKKDNQLWGLKISEN